MLFRLHVTILSGKRTNRLVVHSNSQKEMASRSLMSPSSMETDNAQLRILLAYLDILSERAMLLGWPLNDSRSTNNAYLSSRKTTGNAPQLLPLRLLSRA